VAKVSGINHITLTVRELATALAFYCDVLGCGLVVKWPTGAYLLAGDTWLALVEGTPADVSDDYTHIAFAVDDFDVVADRIRRSGAVVWQENWTEGASLYFLDPAGHRLELHATTLADRIRDALASPWDGLEVLRPDLAAP
jgi:catechol 2,3-dioxygenase-like lactoylglutathione lyase family enzyme